MPDRHGPMATPHWPRTGDPPISAAAALVPPAARRGRFRVRHSVWTGPNWLTSSTQEAPMSRDTSVSLAGARRPTKAGQAKAAETGSPSNIVVVDAGGSRRDDLPHRIFDYERL